VSEKYILALDQGTTSSRAILYDLSGKELRSASRELAVHFPKPGWVEQNPDEIWKTQWEAMKEAASGFEAHIAAIGITNQRETTVAWDRKTGEALAPAVVWQCRRSASICDELKKQDLGEKISSRTGLVIDSYFSATKISWLMRNTPGLHERVRRKEVVFGTIDSWLLYKLSAGKTFATDFTNASRTMLLDIERNAWDGELLEHFELSSDNLPEIKNSDAEFTETAVLGRTIPVRAVLGDQQASLFGHECWEQGTGKCTFGTGAFLLVNCGEVRPSSQSGLLSTIAWQRSGQPRSFALEGSVFVAGSLIQWMRDKLRFIKEAQESEALAGLVESSEGVILVPAFVGLGAPYWSEQVRGAIFGLTRDTSPAHLARAALEAVCQQVADLVELPELRGLKRFRIDGGMARNALFCQLLADFTGVQVEPAPSSEVTAKGAAAFAALGAVFGGELKELKHQFFQAPEQVSTYQPKTNRENERRRWRKCISGLLEISEAQ